MFRGQYSLQFTAAGGTQETACIDWNAPASVFASTHAGISNLDSVHVVRRGQGSIDDDYLYRYEIYFNGNGVYRLGNVGKLVSLVGGAATGTCFEFQTIESNVYVSAGVNGAVVVEDEDDVDCSVCEHGGIDIDATSETGGEDMKAELEKLPFFETMGAHVSLKDDQGGILYTLAFISVEGDVVQMVCGTDTDFDTAQGTCVAHTQVDGNVVGGTFLLEGTGPIPYNADAETLRTYLTASATVGDVHVTREGPDGQQGYTYLITFIADEGDVPALTAVSSLTGTAANIKVDEVTQGNYLGGTFQLRIGHRSTDDILYSASAADVKLQLQDLDNIGHVDVSETAVDTEGGKSWFVTFRDVLNGGDVDLMVADDAAMTGEGKAAVVRETVKGSEAVSNQLSVSFETPLTFNGDFSGTDVSPLSKCRVQWDTSSNFDANVQSYDITEGALLYDEQRIIVASDSVSMSGLKSSLAYEIQTVAVAAVPFKLSFRGDEADFSAGDTLAQIATELETLFSISGVEVTANAGDLTFGSGDAAIGSVFDVKFTEQLRPLPAMTSSDDSATVAITVSGATPFRKEIQVVECSHTSGDIDMSFMIASETVTVNYDATQEDLKEHLESLSSISSDDGVTVWAENGDTSEKLCNVDGNGDTIALYIQFNRQTGDLPAITTASNVDSPATGGAIAIEDNSDRAVKGITTIAESASGTFQIQFQGAPTGPMNAAGSASDMRASLESHADINTVKVTRDLSKKELTSTLSAVQGQCYMECGASSTCDFAAADFGAPGTLLYMGGAWYTVIADTVGPALSSTKLYLGNADGVPTPYTGSTSADTRVFEWNAGYEWTVVMLSLQTDLELLTMYTTDFGIPDATVEILGKDCDNCTNIVEHAECRQS
jgi:hypothetical protein